MKQPKQTARPASGKGVAGAARLYAGGTKRRRATFAAVCAVAAIALLACAFFGEEGGTYVSYPTFTEQLDNRLVESAVIEDGRVSFTLAGDEAAYYTDNPERDGFKEQLLLAGVAVESATNASDILYAAMDLLLFAFVFGTFGGVLVKLVTTSRNTFKVVRRTGVTFDDVAGMNQVKREMRTLVDVLKDPEGWARKGVRPVKGVILEGPPGNGKTLFAKALAQEAGVNFIATKGADFQSAFMSLGARKIRMLFSKAARHRPCIVFIDEFDSIGERRNYAGTGIDKENNRIITAMLNEMDGFTSKDGILVMAATNSYRSLDPALVRPGRFDLKFNVGNPDAATRRELVALYTKGRTLDAGLSAETLANAFEGLSCAAIEACLNGAATLALGSDAGAITLEHVREAACKADVKLAG